MNGKLEIHFLIWEGPDAAKRRELLRRTCENGVSEVCIFIVDDTDEALPAAPEISGAQVLYVTDSGCMYQTLTEKGLPAVGCLYEGNRPEDFPGAIYLVEDPQEVDGDSWIRIYQRLTGQPWTIAETERLRIREMTPDDLDALYALYGDSDAQRYLDPLSEDREEEAALLKAYVEKVYGLYGYGMWAVCDKKSGEMIGRAGLTPYEGNGKAEEIGYLIRADRRGKGLASEAAAAVLKFAKESIGLDRVRASTAADNAASIALLKKLEFKEVDAAAEGNVRYFEKKL